MERGRFNPPFWFVRTLAYREKQALRLSSCVELEWHLALKMILFFTEVLSADACLCRRISPPPAIGLQFHSVIVSRQTHGHQSQ
jgi:hypothetical protein